MGEKDEKKTVIPYYENIAENIAAE
jgi:hypothetical protein